MNNGKKSLFYDILKTHLVFFTQEIVSAAGKTLYFEMLARVHYNDEFYAPDSFLDDMNAELVMELFFMGLDAMSELQERHPMASFGINLNPDQIKDRVLSELILNKIESMVGSGLIDASRCVIELTEDAKSETLLCKDSVANMHRIKSLGIAISLDDFGDRNSNFGYILRNNEPKLFDIVKIDGIFVIGLENDKEKQKVLKKIIEIMKIQGVEVVIEHIENEEIFNIVCCNGEDLYLQGYYVDLPTDGLGRPVENERVCAS